MSKRNYLDYSNAITKVLCGVSLALACAPAWSDADQPRYTMTVFSESAQGLKIMKGQYKQAIENFEKEPAATDNVYRGTNLCVAYTKSGALDMAAKACAAAVASADRYTIRRSASAFGDSTYLLRKRNLAIALSNRGVLHAVQGSEELAWADFDAAAELDDQLAAPKENLARLGQSYAGPEQLSRAGH